MNFEVIRVDYDLDRNERYLMANRYILDDFEKFKKNNELLFCSLHATKKLDLRDNATNEVYWSTTRKYKNENDLKKIFLDFENFSKINVNYNCQISKMTCQDDTYIIEYSIFMQYIVQAV
ncbi:hypothetical protein D3C87_80590 [compost metagenome]